MTKTNKAPVFLKLAIGLVIFTFVSIASAVERDLIIVLDNSRNMERAQAADVVPSMVGQVLDGLDSNARAALILSAETPSVAIPLNRPMDESRVDIPKALDHGEFSDIPEALEQAFHELARNGREQAEKSILLIVGALSDPREVTEVQYRLHTLGYPVGPLDGLIGPKTRGALREFQRDQGWPVDGQLGRGLLGHLDKAYGERWAAELSEQATRAGIKIVAVTLGGESSLVQRLAEQTSGESIQVSRMEELPQLLERLAEAFARTVETPPLPTPEVIADIPTPEAEEPLPQPPPKALLAEEQQEETPTAIWLWVGFIVFILALLSLDLGVFHRHSHVIPVQEALTWSSVWVGLALLFNVFIYFSYEYHWFALDTAEDVPDGWAAAALFFTGYVVELSLSVDNLFVIAMIFSYFAVPSQYQHRVLFWGILGALVMRAVAIVVGAVLIQRFHWILYLFGVLLIFTAARMLLAKHEPVPRDNLLVRLARRLFPITDNYVGQRFVVRKDGKLMLTPLMLALITVEGSDLMFAVDSIPAIFAITDDPFIVFSSNVFAILGLRSLYFALAGIMDKFHYLKLSLALLLALIGVKMLLKDVLHTVPNMTYYTLGAIALILTAGVIASLIRAKRMNKENRHEGQKAQDAIGGAPILETTGGRSVL
jgi:tellurite resistance protein TerC